jgi:hypothetical protein
MADLTVAQRVEAGAAWLDEHKPGWWQTIDLDTLDIRSDCNCVLGQTYGNYCDAPLGSRYHRNKYLGDVRGFNSDESTHSDDDAELADYAALTAAWRALVEERRSGVPA